MGRRGRSIFLVSIGIAIEFLFLGMGIASGESLVDLIDWIGAAIISFGCLIVLLFLIPVHREVRIVGLKKFSQKVHPPKNNQPKYSLDALSDTAKLVREALLNCKTLTKEEVDEFIAYEYVTEIRAVSSDYELTHYFSKTFPTYKDGVLVSKTAVVHPNPISDETKRKIRRVWPYITEEFEPSFGISRIGDFLL